MIDENFIKEWIAYQQEAHADDNTDIHWTDDYLINLLLKNEFDTLWEFVMRVYRRGLSQAVIGILAAGPLEDVLAARGEEYIGRVDILAANDQRFRYLLGGVWQNSMSSEVWERVCKVRQEWE